MLLILALIEHPTPTIRAHKIHLISLDNRPRLPEHHVSFGFSPSLAKRGAQLLAPLERSGREWLSQNWYKCRQLILRIEAHNAHRLAQPAPHSRICSSSPGALACFPQYTTVTIYHGICIRIPDRRTALRDPRAPSNSFRFLVIGLLLHARPGSPVRLECLLRDGLGERFGVAGERADARRAARAEGNRLCA